MQNVKRFVRRIDGPSWLHCLEGNEKKAVMEKWSCVEVVWILKAIADFFVSWM